MRTLLQTRQEYSTHSQLCAGHLAHLRDGHGLHKPCPVETHSPLPLLSEGHDSDLMTLSYRCQSSPFPLFRSVKNMAMAPRQKPSMKNKPKASDKKTSLIGQTARLSYQSAVSIEWSPTVTRVSASAAAPEPPQASYRHRATAHHQASPGCGKLHVLEEWKSRLLVLVPTSKGLQRACALLSALALAVCASKR
jgi:hypothetical protein